MTILQAYIKGWKQVLHYPRMWFLLYAFNVLFALIIILPFYTYLSDAIGQSVVTDRLLSTFDLGIVTDLLNEYGGWNILNDHALVLILLYFFFSAFTIGGIVRTYLLEIAKFKNNEFWKQCSTYFWKMLRLGIYFLIFHAILMGISFFFFQLFSKGMSTDLLKSEVTIINALYVVGIPYVFLASFLMMLHDYSKVFCVARPNFWLYKSIVQAIKFVFKNLLTSFPLYLLHLLTFVFFYAIYKWIDMNYAMNSGLSILVLFLLGQLFIFIRIGIKLANLASAISLAKKN